MDKKPDDDALPVDNESENWMRQPKDPPPAQAEALDGSRPQAEKE
jgi:hypothetical protein